MFVRRGTSISTFMGFSTHHKISVLYADISYQRMTLLLLLLSPRFSIIVFAVRCTTIFICNYAGVVFCILPARTGDIQPVKYNDLLSATNKTLSNSSDVRRYKTATTGYDTTNRKSDALFQYTN